MAHIDLDAAKAARREVEETHSLTFQGKTFTIPSEAPWAYLEACMGGRNPNEVPFLAVRAILGDQYDQFTSLRPTLRDASELVGQVAELWGVAEGESEASGDSSENTSRRSRQTSKGSTGSTSAKSSGAKSR